MPIAIVYLVQQPEITERGNDSFVRIGDSSPKNIPGFYVYVTDPVPTSSEIRNYLLRSPQLRRIVRDGYREIKSKNKIMKSKIVVDKRTPKVPPPKIEPMLVVKLGGSFEQTGDDYENVGGDNQKVG